VFDAKLIEWPYVWRALAGFVLFVLVSGIVYVINDLADMERDRQHPKKSRRPLPSGELSPRVALVFAAVGSVVTLGVAVWLFPLFGMILLGYWLLQLAYSFWLKSIVLLDVITVAMGFVLRVAGGALLVNAERFSPWLYLCMTLVALFMALGKRRGELVLLGAEAGNHRDILKEYNFALLDQLIGAVTSATILAYAFYTFTAPNLPKNHGMMLTIPFVIYGFFRYLYLIHVRGITLAPDEVVLTDRPLQATFVLWGVTATGILYLGQ
jgi:4-hydroxybenzoate polyprenyltransferase